MKITGLTFEIVRATTAVAEFLVRVELDIPAEGSEISGRAVGPRCPGVSTVEVVYLMTRVGRGGNEVALGCVIPEPNLWKPAMPFTYGVRVEMRAHGVVVDSRDSMLALKGE